MSTMENEMIDDWNDATVDQAQRDEEQRMLLEDPAFGDWLVQQFYIHREGV